MCYEIIVPNNDYIEPSVRPIWVRRRCPDSPKFKIGHVKTSGANLSRNPSHTNPQHRFSTDFFEHQQTNRQRIMDKFQAFGKNVSCVIHLTRSSDEQLLIAYAGHHSLPLRTARSRCSRSNLVKQGRRSDLCLLLVGATDALLTLTRPSCLPTIASSRSASMLFAPRT